MGRKCISFWDERDCIITESIASIDHMLTTVVMDRMGTMIIRNIDEELRKEFRKLCIDEDISMNRKVIELISEYVADSKK